MNEDAKVNLYSKTFVPDGMGGGEYRETYHGSIDCEIAPITTKLIDANGRVISHQILKLFTETKIELDNFIVEYNNKKYKKFYETDYTEIIMYELELI